MRKYCAIIENLDLDRVGQNVTILTPLMDLFRRLSLALAVCICTNSPIFVIFVFNFSTLFYLMFILYFSPFKKRTEQIRAVVNELTILVVNYHIICMTDFVRSVHAQNKVGDSMIGVVILNAIFNVYLSLKKPTRKVTLITKRYYLRCLSKRAQIVKPVV